MAVLRESVLSEKEISQIVPCQGGREGPAPNGCDIVDAAAALKSWDEIKMGVALAPIVE